MEKEEKTNGGLALEMRRISKRSGRFAGIADFSLRLEKGTVHGVAGEHGAGKTTLARILGGLWVPDGGSILIEGEEVNLRSPRVAAAWGIGCAGETPPYIPGLTLADHLALGSEFAPSGKLGKRAAFRQAQEVCEQFGIPLDLEQRADEMTRGDWLWAEILRMVIQKRDILVLEEPDVIFTRQEMETLTEVLKRICGEGSAALLLSGSPETVLQACGQGTVLRPGLPSEAFRTKEMTAETLARLMRGEIASPVTEKKEITLSPALEVRRLTVRSGERDADPAHELSFEVRSGEILCLLGRPDQDWDAVAAALMGAVPAVGRIKLGEKEISRASVYDRIQAGMAYLPQDVRRLEMADGLSLEENLTQRRYREIQESGWIKRKQRRKEAETILEESGVADLAGLDCFPRELEDETLRLAALAMELNRKPALLIVEEPAGHLSAEAAALMRERLFSLRANRRAVLLLTSRTEEAMRLADRILVLYEGEIMGEFDPVNTSDRELGWYLSGQWRQQRYGGAAIEGDDE